MQVASTRFTCLDVDVVTEKASMLTNGRTKAHDKVTDKMIRRKLPEETILFAELIAVVEGNGERVECFLMLRL